MRRLPCFVGLVVLVLLGLSRIGWAQQTDRLIIHNVTSELLATGEVTLVITGVGFGEAPAVTVDGQPVPVLAGASATRVMVLAPPAVLTTPGTYRLTVVDPPRQVGDVFVVASLSEATVVAAPPQAWTGGGAGTSTTTSTSGGTLVLSGGATSPSPAAGPGGTGLVEDPGSPYRTAIGYQALFSNTTGSYNTAAGYQALLANTTGGANTAGGAYALNASTSGVSNTALGAQALQANTTGSQNTASGAAALLFNSTGTANTALGVSALWLNTTGTNNTALGLSAGSNATTGHHNLFLGAQVLGEASDTNTIRLGLAYDGKASPPSGQNRTFVAGIRGSAVADALPVVIDANGQLGTADTAGSFVIGTAGNAQLTVNGNVVVRDLTGDAAVDTVVGHINGQARLWGATESTGIASIAFRTDPTTWYKGAIAFSTNDIDGTDPAFPPVERMRITAAGNVGIGTTAPLSRLTVNGNVILRNRAEDAAVDTVVGFVSGQPRLYGASETSGIANIAFRTDPTAWYKGGITFSTNDTDGTDPAYPPVERMRITAAGNVGIGTTAPGYPLHVVGSVYATGAYLGSDARLKEQVQPLGYGVKELLRLRPVSYRWKDPTLGQPTLGLIAQEVQPILPELVARGTDEAGLLSLNYTGLIPVLVKAVQDQQETIADLRLRLAALEEQVHRLVRQEQ